jgi:hypothetical protein
MKKETAEHVPLVQKEEQGKGKAKMQHAVKLPP